MKHIKFLITLFFPILTCSHTAFAQEDVPAALIESMPPIYPVRVQKDIVYGAAMDYAGVNQTLKLDIYKPIGDGNKQRPLIVFAHSGAWQEASSKEQNADRAICVELAKRGFVVASIEYRRGFHRPGYYVNYWSCKLTLDLLGFYCGNGLDTNEYHRAVYRGMQDMKGAIRFMKARNLVDSTSTKNVFASGYSAGGFIALYTTYLDCEGEKPKSCKALASAPKADPDFYSCNTKVLSLARPDLGSIHGTLHLNNGYDASVMGAAIFCAGVFHNIYAAKPGTKLPALYAYHRTDDVVVPYGAEKLFQPVLDQIIYPLEICQPVYSNPVSYGSGSIVAYLKSIGTPTSNYSYQLLNVGPPFVWNIPGAVASHEIDNNALRAQQVADFFAPFIKGQKQLANATIVCTQPRVDEAEERTEVAAEEIVPMTTDEFDVSVAPTLFGLEGFTIRVAAWQAAEAAVVVMDPSGRVVEAFSTALEIGKREIPVQISGPEGVYFVSVRIDGKQWNFKVFKTQ